MRPNLIAGFGVAAAALLFAGGLPSIDATGGYSGLSPRFLPMVVVAGLAICATLLIARGDSVSQDPPQGRASPSPPPMGVKQAWDGPAPASEPDDGALPSAPAQGNRVARLLTLLAGLTGTIALIGTLGFVTCATLLMVAVARAFGSRRPLRDGLVGLALTLPLWLVFTRLLGLSLPLLPALGI